MTVLRRLFVCLGRLLFSPVDGEQIFNYIQEGGDPDNAMYRPERSVGSRSSIPFLGRQFSGTIRRQP
jgi:hypothetical protein